MAHRSSCIVNPWPARTGRAFRLFGLAAVLSLAGCGELHLSNRGLPPPVTPPKSIASYTDTIGSYGELPIDQTILLRGYGLVVLPKPTGSRECPPGIRKVLLTQLNRLRSGETGSVLENVKPEEWISSMNTAVVEVRGLMPAGALANEEFDILVTALPGSQTTSLEGGTLLVTDLSVWRRSQSGGLIHGKTIAVASGPIFINPFAEQNGPAEPTMDNPFRLTSQPDDRVGAPVGTPVDFRRGWVLGGAMVLKDQPLELIFREPDYAHANMAQQQLNTRFPSGFVHGVAHATGPSVVELKVPREYRNQVNWWLALVRQVYLRREPGFLERRTTQLVEEMAQPDVADADRMRAAITFAAIGKPCLPLIQPLYSSESASVAYHAAYAGLRIGDAMALRSLLEIVRNKDHRYRLDAIQALGHPHPFPNIAVHLAPVLDEENVEIRTEAYRSMIRLGSSVIDSQPIGLNRLGFQLDIVRCKGPYLIYVTRSEAPRIALFGGDTLRATSPLFLHSNRTGLSLMAGTADAKLAMMRTNPATDRLMVVKTEEQPELDATGQPKIDLGTKQPITRTVVMTDLKTSFQLAEIVRRLGQPPLKDPDTGELKGLGLNYSQMVHTLYTLSQQRAVPARMVMQQLRRTNNELATESQPLVTDNSRDNVQEDPKLGTKGPASQPDDSSLTIEKPTGGPPKIGS